MLRCWDEYDRTERLIKLLNIVILLLNYTKNTMYCIRYSFRLKHTAEVVCAITVWSLHSIVTAHDDGNDDSSI
jgi:hypothetical protein